MSNLIDHASKGNLKAVRDLIDTGVNIDVQDELGRSALMLSSKNGYLEIVKTLVNAEAALNLQGNEMFYGGNTALMYACRNGHLEIVKTLTDSGAALDLQGSQWGREGYTALMYASCISHYQKIVKTLVDAGADVNIQDKLTKNTALIHASQKGCLEIVKTLVDAETDVNIKNEYEQTALMRASREDYLEIVKTLIQAGADLNLQGQAQGTTEKGWTALIHASRVGNLAVVKCLVDAGADLNLKTKGGWTALMHASDQSHKEVVKVLRAAESGKPHDSDDLIRASENGYLKTVKALIDAGADVNIKNGYGKTALMCASRKGCLEIVKILIQARADLNLQDQDQWTALIYASGAGHLEIVKYLVDAGADLNLKTKGGWTASMHASDQGHREVVTVLRAAKPGKPHDPDPGHRRSLIKILGDLFEISGYLAKVDGRISREEIKAITNLMNEMQLGIDQRRQAEDLFRRGKQASDANMTTLVSGLRDQYHATPEVLNILVMVLMQVAYSDGDMTDPEQKMIRAIAVQLNLDQITLDIMETVIYCKFQNVKYLDLQDAYKIIGISDAASHGDIKQAYRNLLKIYHPDALQSRDLPKEMLVFGTRLSQIFNLAYDRINESKS